MSDQSSSDPTGAEVTTAVSLLLVGASLSATAVAISKVTGIAAGALLSVLQNIGWNPMQPRDPAIGPAEAAMDSVNTARRAAYILKSARRVEGRVRSGQAANEEEAQRQEKYLYEAHMEAMMRRQVMAKRVDGQAQIHGELLGWYAVLDGRTDASCRKADGANFSVLRPPVIGYPGTVHPRCRCTPGPPHPTRRLVI